MDIYLSVYTKTTQKVGIFYTSSFPDLITILLSNLLSNRENVINYDLSIIIDGALE